MATPRELAMKASWVSEIIVPAVETRMSNDTKDTVQVYTCSV